MMNSYVPERGPEMAGSGNSFLAVLGIPSREWDRSNCRLANEVDAPVMVERSRGGSKADATGTRHDTAMIARHDVPRPRVELLIEVRRKDGGEHDCPPLHESVVRLRDDDLVSGRASSSSARSPNECAR